MRNEGVSRSWCCSRHWTRSSSCLQLSWCAGLRLDRDGRGRGERDRAIAGDCGSPMMSLCGKLESDT